MTIKPMAHQLASLKHNDTTPIVYDASDAGTGKTLVRVLRFAKRRAKGGKKLLVLGVRSTLRSVWFSEFKKAAPDLKVSVADAANREAAFAVDADVYVTNHDASKWLAKQKPAFFAQFDEIVMDESTAFKHYTSQRSRALLRIIKHFKYRTCMSATPTSNTIVDIWHQILLLDNGARLGKLYYPFRQSVATPEQTGRDTRMVTWTDKDGAEEAVFSLISDIVVRHKLDDCADIPENHHYPLAYEMSAKQKKAYMEMEQSQVLWLDQVGATAINKAAVRTKLLQIASGAVYSSPDKYLLVDTSRYELVLDLCEQRKHPLVLFLWNHQRDQLIAGAEARGMKYEVFDGDTSDSDRAVIVKRYQAGHYDALLAHPKTVGHGQTLTRGTSTIWASPTSDLELAIQASSRQRRLGQTEKTETLVVVAEGTIDEVAYESMLQKDTRQNNLLDLMSSAVATPKKRKAAA